MSEKEKVENGKLILEQIQSMRSQYQAAEVDVEEEELSFLDKLNKLVQLILNDSTFSAYTALNPQSLERWHKKKISRAIKKLILSNYKYTLYFLLLATITGFLVSEALAFYALDGIITTKTYVKAILTEVCFIFLSAYQTKSKLELAWVSMLRVGIFTLMLFVITSQTLDIGTRTISENASIAQQISLIEEQVRTKEDQMAYYQKKDWPRNYSRVSIEKQALLEKLIKLKEEQASGKNESVSEVERYKMYGRAGFRVLLLFISVLVSRRIFKF